jgi:hypothetical protein
MKDMLNPTRRAPSRLDLVRLSVDQAERLLAAIWCVLEAYSLATPTLEVRPAAAADLIDIILTFRSAEDCSIVRACWRSPWHRGRQARRQPSPHGPIRLAPKMREWTRASASTAMFGAEPESPEPEAAPQPQVSEAPREVSSRLSISAAQGCRFVIGDPKDFHVLGETIYCAAPVERIGEPYCALHRKICYGAHRQAGTLDRN